MKIKKERKKENNEFETDLLKERINQWSKKGTNLGVYLVFWSVLDEKLSNQIEIYSITVPT